MEIIRLEIPDLLLKGIIQFPRFAMIGSTGWINKAGINRSVNPKMLYLSFLAINYNISVITDVQSWFESCIIRSYAIQLLNVLSVL